MEVALDDLPVLLRPEGLDQLLAERAPLGRRGQVGEHPKAPLEGEPDRPPALVAGQALDLRVAEQAKAVAAGVAGRRGPGGPRLRPGAPASSRPASRRPSIAGPGEPGRRPAAPADEGCRRPPRAAAPGRPAAAARPAPEPRAERRGRPARRRSARSAPPAGGTSATSGTLTRSAPEAGGPAPEAPAPAAASPSTRHQPSVSRARRDRSSEDSARSVSACQRAAASSGRRARSRGVTSAPRVPVTGHRSAVATTSVRPAGTASARAPRIAGASPPGAAPGRPAAARPAAAPRSRIARRTASRAVVSLARSAGASPRAPSRSSRAASSAARPLPGQPHTWTSGASSSSIERRRRGICGAAGTRRLYWKAPDPEDTGGR